MIQFRTIYALVWVAGFALLISCSGGGKQPAQTTAVAEQAVAQPVEINNEAKQLLSYQAETGDYVNSRQFPSMISAEAAHEALAGKTLVIDMRKSDVYAKGHIKGAVNVEMAVNALTSANEACVHSGDATRLRWMRCWIVTLLAESRLGNLEQLFVRGAVRIVAVGAVLDDGRMLPEERPALLGVAAEARLVD